MKIDYLSGSRLPSTAANGVHVVKMCSAFAANGHEVRLYCRDAGGVNSLDLGKTYGVSHPFAVSGVRYSSLPLFGSWQYSRDIRDLSRKQGLPELYYGRNIHALSMVSRLDVPCIYECHAPPETLWQRRALENVLSGRTLRRVVAISAALGSELVRRFPKLKADLLIVAHDGADDPGSRGVQAESVLGRAGMIQVGYAGHLYRGKGMELVPSLARALPDMDFHIVGGTPDDVALWSARVRLPNLHFHGHVPHAKVNEYLQTFDIVLAPYQVAVTGVGGRGDVGRWMSPLKIFEYMANGRSILASDLPVIREVLTDGVNALLCPPDDPASWVRRLRELAGSLPLRTALGAQARVDFLGKFTWQARAAAVLS